MKEIYTQLQKHSEVIKSLTLRELFTQNSDRFEEFHIDWQDFLLDYSKNNVTKETIDLLIRLAEESNLKQAIQDMLIKNQQ